MRTRCQLRTGLQVSQVPQTRRWGQGGSELVLEKEPGRESGLGRSLSGGRHGDPAARRNALVLKSEAAAGRRPRLRLSLRGKQTPGAPAFRLTPVSGWRFGCCPHYNIQRQPAGF